MSSSYILCLSGTSSIWILELPLESHPLNKWAMVVTTIVVFLVTTEVHALLCRPSTSSKSTSLNLSLCCIPNRESDMTSDIHFRCRSLRENCWAPMLTNHICPGSSWPPRPRYIIVSDHTGSWRYSRWKNQPVRAYREHMDVKHWLEICQYLSSKIGFLAHKLLPPSRHLSAYICFIASDRGFHMKQ